MFVPSSVKVFVRDRIILAALIISGVLELAMWFVVLGRHRFATDTLILHYNIEFGVDLIGSWLTLLVLPITGLLFFVLDMVLGYFAYNRLRLLSYVLCGILLFVHVVLFTTVLLILFLNS